MRREKRVHAGAPDARTVCTSLDCGLGSGVFRDVSSHALVTLHVRSVERVSHGARF